MIKILHKRKAKILDIVDQVTALCLLHISHVCKQVSINNAVYTIVNRLSLHKRNHENPLFAAVVGALCLRALASATNRNSIKACVAVAISITKAL